MGFEELIAGVLQAYGQQIWMTFVVFIITTFLLLMLKNLVEDLVNYFRARISDIGRGQRIFFEKQIFVIDRITFKNIEAHDDERVILIPIDKYLNNVKEYPKPRYDDFIEEKYFQKPWDGKTERRLDNRKDNV